MSLLGYIIVYSALGGVVSLIGGVWLLRSRKSADTLAKYATPFAGGALLSAVFLNLIKEGLEVDSSDLVLMSTLIGIVIFFIAEGFLNWFHHHHEHQDSHDPSAWLVIFGDTAHNALDGVAIAAAFLVNIPTGIVTTIAVAVHEIPQEIGDFGLLLAKGMPRKKVLIANFISALATVFFAIITYFVGSAEQFPIGALLGLSAGFLLYIATSDIIPSIHHSQNEKKFFNWQVALLLAGVLIVGIITNLAHHYIELPAS